MKAGDRLPKPITPPLLDQQGPWAFVFAAAALATLAAYGLMLARLGGGVADILPDDARQFLAWSWRLKDPAALSGDLLADYWRSVAPEPWVAVYGLGARAGLAPPVVVVLLSGLLFSLSALGAWRLALAMTRRPLAALVAAMLVLVSVIHDDSVWSGTPRAFYPPLLLFAFDAMVRLQWLRAGALVGALAAFYPAPAIAAYGMLVLWRIRWRPRLALDLEPRALLGLLLATAGLAAAGLSFVGGPDQWGPTVTLAEARELANLASPQGRSTIMNPWGGLGVVCNPRLTFVPLVYPCDRGWWVAAASWALLLPLALLAWQAVRGLPDETTAERQRLYLTGLVSALGCYLVALALAFQLHLPARYSQRPLALLELLALGQLVGLWLNRAWMRRRPKPATIFASAALGALLLWSTLTPLPGLHRLPPGLGGHIAELPAEDTLIAGIALPLEAVPALRGRAVLATAEHAIPWQRGYGRLVEQRLADTVELTLTASAERFAELVSLYSVSHVVHPVRAQDWANDLMRVGGAAPQAVAGLGPLRAPRDSFLVSQTEGCETFDDGAWRVVDARCAAALAAAERAGLRPPAAAGSARSAWPYRAPRRRGAAARPRPRLASTPRRRSTR